MLDKPKSDPNEVVAILRCSTCRNVVNCTRAELAGYIEAGWPTCCREVMSYFRRDNPPTVDKSA